MPESIKLKCKECGEVEIDNHFESSDYERIILPMGLYPTEKDALGYYEGLSEEKLEKYTIEEINADDISHLSYEDDGKRAEIHILEPFKAWYLDTNP